MGLWYRVDTKATRDGGKKKYWHTMRAEKALGRPLPPKAVVHHADGSKSDDGPLVICQDQAYHMLLHFRMRIKAAGGNPDLDSICSCCGAVKPREAFTKHSGFQYGIYKYCRKCKNQKDTARYRSRSALVGGA